MLEIGAVQFFHDAMVVRTAEIHIRIALMNRFNALGTAKIVRAA